MNCFGSWVCVLVGLMAALVGCSSKKDLPTGVDTSKLEIAFRTAESNLKNDVAKLVSAISSNNYVDSILILRRFYSDPRLTSEQRSVAKNVMYEVQGILAEAADKGDIQAQKAVEEFERRTRGKR